MKNNFKADYIRRRLYYDRETGVLRWIPKPIKCVADRVWNENKSGQIAGSAQPDGQWFIYLDGIPASAQWLAYTHVTGRRPADEIVHINGDVSDNRFVNLRPDRSVEPPLPITRPRDAKAIKPSVATQPRVINSKIKEPKIRKPKIKEQKIKKPRIKTFLKTHRSDTLTDDRIKRARAVLRYDTLTGEITREYSGRWRRYWHYDAPRTRAYVAFERIKSRAEVMAWILTYGRNPVGTIKHLDGDMFNNRLNNLAEGAFELRRTSNNRSSERTNNTSGFIGVIYVPESGHWVGRINYRNKRTHLGTFTTKEEAIEAVQNYRKKLPLPG